MIAIFHGRDEETHLKFQGWRKANPDGFHMTEHSSGQFVIHYTQDKRENSSGRGCAHQGGSDQPYSEGAYTVARKVCSAVFSELIAWSVHHSYSTRNCSHCDTARFPFPIPTSSLVNLPEEVTVVETYPEGSVKQVLVNAYERDPRARSRCIKEYGTTCTICGFSFGAAYGAVADGFIHVHHLRPLSEIGGEYQVDPVNDLRPVCPNCHSVLHLRQPSFSIEEVQAFLACRLGPRS